jgi:hypothetical protein
MSKKILAQKHQLGEYACLEAVVHRTFAKTHKGTIVAAGTRQENDILEQADVLEKAREIRMCLTG